MPCQALATGLLAVVMAIVSWVFVSTIDEIKHTIERQADDMKTMQAEMANNHLELVRAIDGVDKSLTAVSGKVDLVTVQVGVKPPPSPPPVPEPKR